MSKTNPPTETAATETTAVAPATREATNETTKAQVRLAKAYSEGQDHVLKLREEIEATRQAALKEVESLSFEIKQIESLIAAVEAGITQDAAVLETLIEAEQARLAFLEQYAQKMHAKQA
ncbi:MAG: hypothetical protein JNK57_20545 [Planctomycetaceae bacterium]|nr:hypothetical protein [Planctomycetaceae bacterium]